MFWIVTWNVIGNSTDVRAEIFESELDAAAFYEHVVADPTTTVIKLFKNAILA